MPPSNFRLGLALYDGRGGYCDSVNAVSCFCSSLIYFITTSKSNTLDKKPVKKSNFGLKFVLVSLKSEKITKIDITGFK